MPRSRSWWTKSSISSWSMKSRKLSARLDQRDRDVQRAEDRGVFDADHAGADHRQAARQARSSRGSRRCRARCVPSNGTSAGRYGRVPTAIRNFVASTHAWIVAARSVTSIRCGSMKRAVPVHRVDAVAGELVLQHLDLVVERHVQPRHQVVGLDVLLDPVGAAVEAALAPAGEVQHRLAQGLGRDGAGMDRDAADPPALLDHQHRLAELGGLDGGAPPGGAAADDDEVVPGSRRATPVLLKAHERCCGNPDCHAARSDMLFTETVIALKNSRKR